ncbi:MAG: hypothetical protein ACRDJT_13390 [Actinomycetota bacterium]
MHPLISPDVAGLVFEDRIREADRRRLAAQLPQRSRRTVRSALGLRVVSLGARLALERNQEAAFLVRADRCVQLTGLGPQAHR